MSKRQFERHKRRLETTFTAGTETYRGMSGDISEGGIFIRTRHCLVPESLLDIEIHLPDGTLSRVKGKVKRSIRTPISTFKNGMGIEIIEKDSAYVTLVKKILTTEGDGGSTSTAQKSSEPDFSIIACPNCGAKNKVMAGFTLIPKCGKCRSPLPHHRKTSHQLEYLIIACSNCSAKNKVARERLSLNPRCGKCGTLLRAGDIIV